MPSLPDRESLRLGHGADLAAEAEETLSPMEPRQLMEAADSSKGLTVEVRSIYDSVDSGVCQGAGSLALSEDAIRGYLELNGKADNTTWSVRLPAQVITRITEVKPALRSIEGGRQARSS